MMTTRELKAQAHAVRARHIANQAAERARGVPVTPLSVEGGELLAMIDRLPLDGVVVSLDALQMNPRSPQEPR